MKNNLLPENTTPFKSESPVTPNIRGAYQDDKMFFRMVVGFSGWTLIISVVGIITISLLDKKMPEGLIAIASGLIGLFTGTFVAKS